MSSWELPVVALNAVRISPLVGMPKVAGVERRRERGEGSRVYWWTSCDLKEDLDHPTGKGA